MKLGNFVFYRQYNDKTFLVDTLHHRTYRFDTPVAEMLDLFKTETTLAEANRQFAARFPRVDPVILSDNLEKMASFLGRHGMFQASVQEEDASKDSKPNTRFFQTYTICEKILYSALFELTYRCPEKCVHCYLEPNTQASAYEAEKPCELTTAEICGALDQLAAMNVMAVTFTGGEPFMRPDIYELLDYAGSKGFLINIFSNGILLKDKDVERLAALHMNCFHSSLYSHIPEKHDAVTGVKGSFEKTIRTLRALSEKGVYVNIKFVLMEQNKNDFSSVISLAGSMNATCQLISCVSPSKNGNCSLCDLTVKSDAELKRVLREWNEISDFHPYKDTIREDAPICEAGRNSISIDPYGKVTPCNAFPYEIGNLRTTSIREIWEKSTRLKQWQQTSFKSLAACSGCTYRGYCSFCPGNSIQQTGSPFGIVPEACRQARLQYALHHENDNR